MHVDQFELRIAKVRHRFASTLEGKIKDAMSSAPLLGGQGADVVEQVAQSYRSLHGICGVGPTVGFTATGQLARIAESVLTQAYFERRPLNEKEVANLTKALEQLRNTAALELRSMYQRGG